MFEDFEDGPSGAGDVDVGDLGPVVFTRVVWAEEGGWVAGFVTIDGGAFTLEAPTLRLRLQLLARQGEEGGEERRALAALARRGS